MLQANTFPQIILTALDALAELGKVAQDKTRIERTIHFQVIEEKEKDQVSEEQLVKSDRNQKQVGK
jgi:hypothetical protein